MPGFSLVVLFFLIAVILFLIETIRSIKSGPPSLSILAWLFISLGLLLMSLGGDKWPTK